MFITQAKEIMEACPTARLDAKDAQRLIRSVEEEEQSLLEPLLGDELIDMLAAQYAKYVDKFGGITTDKLNLQNLEENEEADADLNVPVLRKSVPLLRDIQSALVYRMFSNKIYTISTSLNLGGGTNRASAGEYDPADDKHLQELKKEFWMNSIHACDNILVKLEKDAKLQTHQTLQFETSQKLGGTKMGTGDESAADNSNQLPLKGAGGSSLWYSLWKNSDGFFMKEDSLFPTMRELKTFYPCDQPTRFLAIQPLLMYCQNTYITPRVGEVAPELMERLLDPSHTPTDEEKKAKKLLRVALSLHMQAHQANKTASKNATPFSSSPGIYSISPDKTELAQSADSAMSTALHYISEHLTAKSEEDGSQSGSLPSKGTGASCNRYPGHEDHVDDPRHETGGNGCYCRQDPCDEEYTTFSTLMPGLNRW